MEQKLLELFNIVLLNRGKDKVKKVTSKSNLRDDIGLDSLDLAELTVRIEAEFDIDIFEDGMVTTVGEIMEKLNAN
jgi:acyl carrier protein